VSNLPATAPVPGQPVTPSAVSDSVFLRACRGESVPYTPAWFMRQAGRSLPEYRKLRESVSMLQACTRPELITEITLQPVRRYGVDAAIVFSDIMVPLKAVGVDLDIVPGVGPVIARPIRSRDDMKQLRCPEPDDVSFLCEAIHALVSELGTIPLIGFAGAPFTLASYLIEGRPSRDYAQTKAMMYGEPQLWAELLDRLVALTAAFLRVQIEAGASAVQLFDSWVGALAAADYQRSVLPAITTVLTGLASLSIPLIHFGVGTGELLRLMAEAGADVMGVDWRVPLDEAARRIGPGRAVQGNLDPAVVFAPWEVIAAKTRQVLTAGKAATGHIFNLGHGVLPTTDPDVLARLVDFIHAESAA